MTSPSKTRIKRMLTAGAVAACAVAFCGCGASVTVKAYTENGVRYNLYTVSIDADTVQKMESSATLDSNGNRYTVNGYFFELFSSFDCEIVDSRYDASAYVASYKKAFDATGDTGSGEEGSFLSKSRLQDIAESIEFMVTYTANPFVRKYVSVSNNPFNGIRAEYDAVQSDETVTVIQRLKNGQFSRDGVTGERITTLPSVTEAFPYLQGIDPDGLLLNYVFTGSKRMSSSGTAKEIGDYAEYVFSRYFDTTETGISFAYTRPVTYGWYGVALAAGGIVFAAIMLATRTKKQKPTLLDKFPYNPEQYRDYETHLPM